MTAGCFLDGYPRTVHRALPLHAFLWEQAWRLRRVYQPWAPVAVVIDRLRERGLDEDRPEVVAARLQLYRRWTEPALDVLRAAGTEFIEIDNAHPREAVERRLDATFEGLVPQGAGLSR